MVNMCLILLKDFFLKKKSFRQIQVLVTFISFQMFKYFFRSDPVQTFQDLDPFRFDSVRHRYQMSKKLQNWLVFRIWIGSEFKWYWGSGSRKAKNTY
jgi:hypothetical protein